MTQTKPYSEVLEVNQKISEGNFRGEFIFPLDIDKIGVVYRNEEDVRDFNQMIDLRIRKKYDL